MRNKALTITFSLIILIACNNQETKEQFIQVDSDSLVLNIDTYCNSNIETEGIIAHVCGVDGKKMKLITKSGEVIKIIPRDSRTRFSKSFRNKSIIVKGQVKETRLDTSYISEIEREKTLLCHIDNTPCKDTSWVNGQIEAGTAESKSNQDIMRLKLKMQQKKKNYVSVITIIADECIEKK